MKVKTDILFRVRITYLAVALFTIAAFYRLLVIQYFESEKWRGLGQTNGLKVMKINATRGNIYAMMVVYWLPHYPSIKWHLIQDWLPKIFLTVDRLLVLFIISVF